MWEAAQPECAAAQQADCKTAGLGQLHQEFRTSPASAGPAFKRGVGHGVAKDFLHKCKKDQHLDPQNPRTAGRDSSYLYSSTPTERLEAETGESLYAPRSASLE